MGCNNVGNKILLLATTNKGKISEYRALLESSDLSIIAIHDLECKIQVSEKGVTEVENAILKAKQYAEVSGCLTLADDSGMYIEALDNKPGVQVRRWCGELSNSISDHDWLLFFLEKMKNVPIDRRKGKFYTAAVIANQKGDFDIVDCQSYFNISNEPHFPVTSGMPINAVRYIPEYGRMWNKLSLEEQLKLHRGSMKDKLVNIINELIL